MAIGAGWLAVTACHAWLHQILTIPHDPQRADMLIVVQQGLQRMLQGRNPYTIYHVPWDAPLPYGPMLWAPYAIPFALRADIRFLTVAGELFVPVACAIAATVCAARGRMFACAGCLAMLAAMCLNPDLERFASIGHTPVYWPLLALFAWLVVRERWYAAAIALGLLVVARTTMVAIVPVLLMAVWSRERAKLPGALALVALAVAVPFLPFAIWDARALAYALYGSYQNVIKGFVWTSTTWAQHTIGLTGVLLSNGLPRLVDAFQEIVMLAVYAACWFAMRRGRQPVAWMGLALLAFSMTTLWPVTYVYFDVFVLLAAAVLAGAVELEAGRARIDRALVDGNRGGHGRAGRRQRGLHAGGESRGGRRRREQPPTPPIRIRRRRARGRSNIRLGRGPARVHPAAAPHGPRRRRRNRLSTGARRPLFK